MAIENDYGQLFCEAVDTIVQKRLENISFDKTQLCTIIDDSKAESGKYRVRVHDGLSEFEAYTSDTSLKNKDVVYVQVPSGDMNEQKFIVAKKTDKSNVPLSYKRPFSSFINITGNLVSNTEGVKAGLIANEGKSKIKPWAEEKTIWVYNPTNPTEAIEKISDYGTDLSKYSRLGIQAQFRSWLNELKAISGSYGLKLRVEAVKEDLEDIQNLTEEEQSRYYLHTLAKSYDVNEIYYIKDGEIYKKVEDLKQGDFISDKYYIRSEKPVYYDFILDSSNMVGNVYNFSSYYQQEFVFDISDIYKIRKMELQFYQKKDFKNKDEQLIEVLKDPNLFVKDVSICLGYDLEEFDTDKAIIYSFDSPKYLTTADPAHLNHKKLHLRWIHKDLDGNIKVVPTENDMDYKIVWYKYRLGSYSHTPKSGADWAPMSVQYSDERLQLLTTEGYEDVDAMRGEEGPFKYNILDKEWLEYNQSAENGLYREPGENQTWLIPDITLAEEAIKVVISYLEEVGNENSRKYLVSNTLTFTNREEVVSKPTVDAVTALTIHCEDNSNGNYLIYNQGGDILDSSQSSQEKIFTAYFKGAPLTNAEYIEWILPTDAGSMIKVENNFLGAMFTSEVLNKKEFKDKTNNDIEDGFYHIFRFGDSTNKYDISHANSQRYKIKSFYSPGYTNNTVQCKVVKDKITYTATKQLRFGPSGTSGSDHTLIIEFDEPNINAVEIGGAKTYYNLRARLYNYEGQEISFDDINDYTLTWDWYKIDNKSTGDGFNALQNHYEDGNYVTTGVSYRKALELNDNIDINELHILQVTLTWRGSQSLIAYFPIPLKACIKSDDENKKYEYGYIQGPDKIVYQSNGNPYYMRSVYRIFKNAYKHRDENEQVDDPWVKIETSEIDAEWSMIHSDESIDNRLYPTLKKSTTENSPDLYTLEPLPLYIDGVPICGVQAKLNGEVIWTQPLLIIMNRYPNGAVNRWDGEGLELDEENGTIIGTAFAAGHKESDNTFSGVMLGDWDKGSQGDVEDSIGALTGVYGLHHGEVSYAFMEDGTAFIGKSGDGRIYFDGDNSEIYSAGYKNQSQGMMIDLGGDGAPYIDMKGGSKYIPYIHISSNTSYINLEASQDGSQIYLYNGSGKFIDINSGAEGGYSDCPFQVGTDFRVDWNGNLYAKNAKLNNAHLSGRISATLGGMIGGWYIGTNTLEGGGGKYEVVTDDETGEITINTIAGKESAIILNSEKGSIEGGILKSVSGLPIFLDGIMSVSEGQDSYNAEYSSEYGFMGAIGSNMGTDEDSDTGVGLWVGERTSLTSVVKATGANAGIAFNSNSVSVNEDRIALSFSGAGSIVIGTNFDKASSNSGETGIIFNCPADDQYGIYARFAP